MKYHGILIASSAVLLFGLTFAAPTKSLIARSLPDNNNLPDINTEVPTSGSAIAANDANDSNDIQRPDSPIEAHFDVSNIKAEWAQTQHVVRAIRKNASKLYFWSGSKQTKASPGYVSVRTHAAAYALEHGGKTLEMILHDMQQKNTNPGDNVGDNNNQGPNTDDPKGNSNGLGDGSGSQEDVSGHNSNSLGGDEGGSDSLGDDNSDLGDDSGGNMVPIWDAKDPEVVKFWSEASVAIAMGAKGVVHVVLGPNLRPGNIWESFELPTLKENPKVTEIIKVDPFKNTEETIFSRSDATTKSKRDADAVEGEPTVTEIKGWSLIRDGSFEGFYTNFKKGSKYDLKQFSIQHQTWSRVINMFGSKFDLDADEAKKLGGPDKFVAEKIDWAPIFKQAKEKIATMIENLGKVATNDSDETGRESSDGSASYPGSDSDESKNTGPGSVTDYGSDSDSMNNVKGSY